MLVPQLSIRARELLCTTVASRHTVTTALLAGVMSATAVVVQLLAGVPLTIALLFAFFFAAAPIVTCALIFGRRPGQASEGDEAAHTRSDFVSALSHEIQTPLTAVLCYLTLALEDHALSATTRRKIEVALSNSDRLLEMIDRMLTAASNDFQPIKPQVHANDLAKVIADAIESITPLASEREVSINFICAANPRVAFDAVRIRQVLDNLLSNAVKYNRPAGQITVTLAMNSVGDLASDSMAARPAGALGTVGRRVGGDFSRVEISVSDSGVGMTEAELARAFDRFYRSPSARDSRPGTGLGLSISRGIMREQGGELTISSREGFGTTVRMSLDSAVEGAGALARSSVVHRTVEQEHGAGTFELTHPLGAGSR